MGISVIDIKRVIGNLCDVVIENEIPWCELDSAAGDGDFGMSVAKGFREVKKQFDDIDTSSIQMFVRGCGMIITEFCGGASGPIWGSAFRSAAMSTKGKEELELADVAEMFDAAVAGIQKRGGAKLGDKTLLDALIPATEALKQAASEGDSVRGAFEKAAKAAVEGAEKTKEYSATKGRASYVGDRSLSYPDAGAVAIGVIFTELSNK